MGGCTCESTEAIAELQPTECHAIDGAAPMTLPRENRSTLALVAHFVWSAYHPIVAGSPTLWQVRVVPTADSCSAAKGVPSSAGKYRGRLAGAERLGSL